MVRDYSLKSVILVSDFVWLDVSFQIQISYLFDKW